MTNIAARELICRFCTEPTKNFTDQELVDIREWLGGLISEFRGVRLGLGHIRKLKHKDAFEEVYNAFSYKTEWRLATIRGIRKIIWIIEKVEWKRTAEYKKRINAISTIRYKSDAAFRDKTLKSNAKSYQNNKEKILQSRRNSYAASKNFDMMKTLLIDMSSVAA
jgi:hypothetical protein